MVTEKHRRIQLSLDRGQLWGRCQCPDRKAPSSVNQPAEHNLSPQAWRCALCAPGSLPGKDVKLALRCTNPTDVFVPPHRAIILSSSRSHSLGAGARPAHCSGRAASLTRAPLAPSIDLAGLRCTSRSWYCSALRFSPGTANHRKRPACGEAESSVISITSLSPSSVNRSALS